MNIALIGHGKMGREVEQAAAEKGIKIARVFTSQNNMNGLGLNKNSLAGIDVCIDFSTPTVALDNIQAVAENGTNIVVGTTGWYDRLDQVKKLVKDRKIGFLYASNFSLGVNLFSQIVLDAAHLFGRYPEYDVAVTDVHHRGKADSPSGTALSLASILLQEMKRKSEVLHETSHGVIKPHQLHITSTRVGHVTGRHAVIFESESDSVELIHTAKNRRGYALGALVAAEWIKGRRGFYTMRDAILPWE
jgi:4-hydroxy-tetrahydrodipicolinate reductase